VNGYFYESSARERNKEWHKEANQGRRVRLLKPRKRTSRGAGRLVIPNPRLNLPPTALFDDPARAITRRRS
jgi:hypothetical protein